jgi:hypothetical protein
MPRFYQPDLGSESDSPFARDANNKLVRRSYWLDMNDRSLVLVMTQGIGAHLTNDEKAGASDGPKTRTPDRSGLCPGNPTAGEKVNTCIFDTTQFTLGVCWESACRAFRRYILRRRRGVSHEKRYRGRSA